MTTIQEPSLAAIVICLLPALTEVTVAIGTVATETVTTVATVIIMLTIIILAETMVTTINPIKIMVHKMVTVRVGVADRSRGEAGRGESCVPRRAGEPSAAYIKRVFPHDAGEKQLGT